jgi:leucyl-tRNA synthetase
MAEYPFRKTEAKWQEHWDRDQIFRAPTETDRLKPKYYALNIFPSTLDKTPLVNDIRACTLTDVVARYKRMRGFNVLYTIGWDAFRASSILGNSVTDIGSRFASQQTINTARALFRSVGISHDPAREINTSDPKYYRWTQWIFLRFLKHGLAYPSEEQVWWCPQVGESLEEDEVANGLSIIGDFPCTRTRLPSWVLSTNAYAQQLLDHLDTLDWPLVTREFQRERIGRSEGMYIDFDVAGRTELRIRVFTTRPDTLFGATYLAIAPEHELVNLLTTDLQAEVVKLYCEAANKTAAEPISARKEKTGVPTGSFAINPINGQTIPILIADYVLSSYGTGTIMGVPGQDERDWEFAERFGLPIIRTVLPPPDFEGKAYTGDGPAINSSFINGMCIADAKKTMSARLEAIERGERRVNFKLRDWIFSRQGVWGEPLPIIYFNGVAQPISDEQLPVQFPDSEGQLSKEPRELLRFKDHWTQTVVSDFSDTHYPAKREPLIMSRWAGSSWHHLRHLDPENETELCASVKEKYWMPVDLYVLSAQHAAHHLLYMRFWHKALRDWGIASTNEPLAKVVHPGELTGDINAVSDVLDRYGADSLRLSVMFIGPLDQAAVWTVQSVEGVHRFLIRLWRLLSNTEAPMLAIGDTKPSREQLHVLHKTIKKVTDDIESFRFNTALAALMELANTTMKWDVIPRSILEPFIILLSPFAPHIAEELWQRLGHAESLTHEAWPEVCEMHLQANMVTIAVQVNGKVRATLDVPAEGGEQVVRDIARDDPRVKPYLTGKKIRREIYVPSRLVNFVVE